MSKRDKELVTLICQDCGKSFTLSYGRFRRLPENNHWRCKTCNNIQRSIRYSNLTDEERIALREQRSRSAKKTWEELTEDEYMRRRKSQQARWMRLSKEEKEQVMRNTHEAQKIYANLPETKSRLRERNKIRWENLTTEERIAELKRLNLIRDEYWNSLSNEDKFSKMKKMWDINIKIGPTEFVFNDLLKSIGFVNGVHYYWTFNTFPYIHPDYFNIFGTVNPVTKEENFPYHSWDFILFPNDEHPLLVDLDGSVHSPNTMNFKRSGNTYTDREKVDYNDSQRPYQIPDGMSGFIIKAYEDKLEDKTVVESVDSKIGMMLKEFEKLIKDRFLQDLSENTVKSSSTIEPLQNT